MTAAVFDHLWQSSLAGLLIGALTLLFRNNSAGIRHGLWFVASMKFLLPFSLLAAIGNLAFSHAVTPGAMQTLARIEPAATPFAAATAGSILVTSGPVPWTLAAAAIWGLGSVAVLLFWLVRAVRLGGIVRRAVPLALDAAVGVRATTALLEPGLVGIIRPVILVPESLVQRLSQAETDAILAHELCHLRRRDNLQAAVHMLVEAIFWFHPLVWFIGARLVEERERACDEGVLDTGKKPMDYAQAILKVCRLYFRSPLPCASGVSGADLDRRITAIMTTRAIDEVDPRKTLLLAGLGVFAVITPLVLGGLKPAPAVHLMQDLTQMLAPAGPVLQPVRETSKAIHKTVPAPTPAPWLRQRLLTAPEIDAGQPIIIVPTPQLDSEVAATPTGETSTAEVPVCRLPQQLPQSRMMGPKVCMPQREWDQIAAQGLQLMPDGRTLAAAYEKAHSLTAHTCLPAARDASSALTTWTVACF